jgi:N-acetylglutamate synthase-like GNAT family acetyltransferase
MNGGWLALVAAGTLAAATAVRGGSRAVSVAVHRDDDGDVFAFLTKNGEMIEDAYLEIRLPSADELRILLVEEGVDTVTAVQPDGPQPVGFLTGMELPDRYQRQGWGKAMLGAAMRKATQIGAREFYVLSLRSAVGFYEKLGFKSVANTAIGPLMRIGLEDE